MGWVNNEYTTALPNALDYEAWSAQVQRQSGGLTPERGSEQVNALLYATPDYSTPNNRLFDEDYFQRSGDPLNPLFAPANRLGPETVCRRPEPVDPLRHISRAPPPIKPIRVSRLFDRIPGRLLPPEQQSLGEPPQSFEPTASVIRIGKARRSAFSSILLRLIERALTAIDADEQAAEIAEAETWLRTADNQNLPKQAHARQPHAVNDESTDDKPAPVPELEAELDAASAAADEQDDPVSEQATTEGTAVDDVAARQAEARRREWDPLVKKQRGNPMQKIVAALIVWAKPLYTPDANPNTAALLKRHRAKYGKLRWITNTTMRPVRAKLAPDEAKRIPLDRRKK